MNSIANPPRLLQAPPATTSPPRTNTESDIISSLQHTVSPSRLSLFLQCRLKFWFRYVKRITKPKTPALHVGSAVHAVLKAWNKARWLQKPVTLKEVHETYLQAWSDNSDGPVPWEPGEEEGDKTTGWRLCETYLRESHVPTEVKPDAVEVPVEADLANHGLPRLVGVLDLVQERQVIDYKTSSSTPNAEKVAHTHEIQTSSYAVLYRHNTGEFSKSGVRQISGWMRWVSHVSCITRINRACCNTVVGRRSAAGTRRFSMPG